MMKRLIPVLAVLLAFTFTFTAEDVYAKKFGGGKSFGRSLKTTPSQPKPSLFSSPSNQTGSAAQSRATQNQQANQSNASRNAPAKKGLFGGAMGGLLGGILAGSLLGSLLGSGAFSGLGIMDILIFAGLAFLLFRLFKSMKRSQSSQHSHYQVSGHNSQWQPQSTPDFKSTPEFKSAPEFKGSEFRQSSVDNNTSTDNHTKTGQTMAASFGDGFKTEFRKDAPSDGNQQEVDPPQSDVPFNLPPDFDLKGFLNRAGDHYRTIQDAWNSGDMNTIRDYVSPELYTHLEKERASLDGDQHTEVMYVDAELARAEYSLGRSEVSLRFSGRYRDNVERVEEKITDIWHLEQASAGAPWLIVGIEYAEE